MTGGVGFGSDVLLPFLVKDKVYSKKVIDQLTQGKRHEPIFDNMECNCENAGKFAERESYLKTESILGDWTILDEKRFVQAALL